MDSEVNSLRILRLYNGAFINVQLSRIEYETEVLTDQLGAKEQLIVQFYNGEDVDEAAGVRVRRVKEKGFFSKAKALARILKQRPSENIHSHCFYTALLAFVAKSLSKSNARLVYEIHGASAFESYYRNVGSVSRYFRFIVLYLLETLAIVLSARLLLVTKYINRFYPLARLKPSISIPRYVSSRLDQVQQEPVQTACLDALLKWKQEKRKILVYSGGIAEWQCLEQTICHR